MRVFSSGGKSIEAEEEAEGNDLYQSSSSIDSPEWQMSDDESRVGIPVTKQRAPMTN